MSLREKAIERFTEEWNDNENYVRKEISEDIVFVVLLHRYGGNALHVDKRFSYKGGTVYSDYSKGVRGPELSFHISELDEFAEDPEEREVIKIIKRGGFYDNRADDYDIYTVPREEVLLETIEGQQLLEKLLQEYNIQLDLATADKRLDDLRPRDIITEEGKWKVEEEEKQITIEKAQQKFMEKLESATDSRYVYVLELSYIETGETAYYVGDSSQPFKRLRNHVQSGGSFSKSSDYKLVSVENAYANKSEKEVYEKYKRETDTGVKVLGGK